MADLKRFQYKIAKAREKHKLKAKEKEEAATIKMEAKARREAAEFERRADIERRRAAAYAMKAAAESKLASEKAEVIQRLREKREAKRKRVMTERELMREQLRPYIEAPKKLAISLRTASESLSKALQEMAPQTTTTRPIRAVRPVTRQALFDPKEIFDTEQLKKDLEIRLL